MQITQYIFLIIEQAFFAFSCTPYCGCIFKFLNKSKYKNYCKLAFRFITVKIKNRYDSLRIQFYNWTHKWVVFSVLGFSALPLWLVLCMSAGVSLFVAIIIRVVVNPRLEKWIIGWHDCLYLKNNYTIRYTPNPTACWCFTAVCWIMQFYYITQTLPKQTWQYQ